MSAPLPLPIRHALFLAPEAVIGPHFEACIRFADILASQGVEVTFLGCFDQDQRCVFQDSDPAHARFLSRVEQYACEVCVSRFSATAASRDYKILSPETLKLHELQLQHCELASKVRTEGLEARIESLSYGLLAGASLLLIKKVSLGSPLSKQDLDYLEDIAFTVLQRHAFVQRAFEATNADVLYVFGQYAQNMAGICAARTAGKLAVILDQPLIGNIDCKRLLVRSNVALTNGINLNAEWKQQARYLNSHELHTLLKGQSATMRGSSSWAYSPPISGSAVNKRKGKERQRIVAFTSSLDEVDCSSLLSMAMEEDGHSRFNSVYPNQIAWINDLQLLAARNSLLDIVIRVHPREGNDARSGGVASRHLDQLHSEAVNWHDLQIFWPQDPVSSYDLLMEADVVTTSWSSITIEAATLGIPTISPWYSNPTFPSDSFVCTPMSREEYLRELSDPMKLIKLRPMDQIKLALDFLAFLKLRMSIPLHNETSWEQAKPSLREYSRINPYTKVESTIDFNGNFIRAVLDLSQGGKGSFSFEPLSMPDVSAATCAREVMELLKNLGVSSDSHLIQRLSADLINH
jgi:hypothetical protein